MGFNHICNNCFSKYLAFEREMFVDMRECQNVLSQLIPIHFLLHNSTFEGNNVDLNVPKSYFCGHFPTFPIFMLQFLSNEREV